MGMYDVDHSGEVDIQEFQQVLYKALKVPPHVELPRSRVKYFWSEIDEDNSGKAIFEEFLGWWLKHFGETGNVGALPFEDFYKKIRPRTGCCIPDPPAYSSAN